MVREHNREVIQYTYNNIHQIKLNINLYQYNKHNYIIGGMLYIIIATDVEINLAF